MNRVRLNQKMSIKVFGGKMNVICSTHIQTHTRTQANSYTTNASVDVQTKRMHGGDATWIFSALARSSTALRIVVLGNPFLIPFQIGLMFFQRN